MTTLSSQKTYSPFLVLISCHSMHSSVRAEPYLRSREIDGQIESRTCWRTGRDGSTRSILTSTCTQGWRLPSRIPSRTGRSQSIPPRPRRCWCPPSLDRSKQRERLRGEERTPSPSSSPFPKNPRSSSPSWAIPPPRTPAPPRFRIGRSRPDRRGSRCRRRSLPRRGPGEKLRDPSPSSAGAATGESRLRRSGREQGKGRAEGRGRGRRRRRETTDRCSSPSPAVPSRRIPAPPRGPCGRSKRDPRGSRSRSRNLPDRVPGGRLEIRCPRPSASAGTEIATGIGPSPLLRLLRSPPSRSRSRRYVVVDLLLLPGDRNRSTRAAQSSASAP